MTERVPPRRRFFARAGGAAAALLLSGCQRLSESEWFPKVLGFGETLSRAAGKLVVPRRAMAQEFDAQDLSPQFRSNGTARPDSAAYDALLAGNFADYRLVVDGLVAAPRSFTLAELRALESRTQITRHDCVEGWSAIGKWKGAKLSALLDIVRPAPEVRYVVFHCAIGAPCMRRSMASWPVWVSASASPPWNSFSAGVTSGALPARYASSASSPAKKRVFSSSHGSGVELFQRCPSRASANTQSSRSPMWARISSGVRVVSAARQSANSGGAPRRVFPAR
jgi:DMSO/TMAO reductase YedYZ molybdopterin-dependent catalytic subunit